MSKKTESETGAATGAPENPDQSEQQQQQERDHVLASRIKDSARQIWLAGLGAYTKAEEDTGKFFERLVKEGEDLEDKTRGAVERQVKAVEDRVGEVKDRATGTWDRLESVFDQRVSKALGRLGIPSYSKMRDLEERVEALEAELAALKKRQR
ncbi:MAG: poly(hydroxyalkanoate) granule-associated protein [Halomonadaceae bacterium]|nr:MAG: poly(hydroxyalkanoate) granule-associated protein [Halomonadaceae bacterium]